MSKIQEAYARAKTVRDRLHKIARCMEVTEDKAGILWERWLVGETQVVLMATPHWVEIFKPVSNAPEWDDTFAALDKIATAKT
jgi:hypothetical protein